MPGDVFKSKPPCKMLTTLKKGADITDLIVCMLKKNLLLKWNNVWQRKNPQLLSNFLLTNTKTHVDTERSNALVVFSILEGVGTFHCYLKFKLDSQRKRHKPIRWRVQLTLNTVEVCAFFSMTPPSSRAVSRVTMTETMTHSSTTHCSTKLQLFASRYHWNRNILFKKLA